MMSTPQALAQATEYCPTSALKRLANHPMLFLDVRSDDDFALLRLDVPETLHIPFHELEQRFQELPRNREIVVVSVDGSKSLQATYFLMFHQFTSVANMKMGLKQWVKREFPTHGEREVWQQKHPTGSNESCC